MQVIGMQVTYIVLIILVLLFSALTIAFSIISLAMLPKSVTAPSNRARTLKILSVVGYCVNALALPGGFLFALSCFTAANLPEYLGGGVGYVFLGVALILLPFSSVVLLGISLVKSVRAQTQREMLISQGVVPAPQPQYVQPQYVQPQYVQPQYVQAQPQQFAVPAAKICPSCGVQLDAQARFCKGCGQNLG